jgi:hypothetical protein
MCLYSSLLIPPLPGHSYYSCVPSHLIRCFSALHIYNVQLCAQNFTSCVVSFYMNSDVMDYKECVLFLDKHTASYQSTGRYMNYCQQRENWRTLFLQENKNPIQYQHDFFSVL